jgi:hypothetical protein
MPLFGAFLGRFGGVRQVLGVVVAFTGDVLEGLGVAVRGDAEVDQAAVLLRPAGLDAVDLADINRRTVRDPSVASIVSRAIL